MFTGVNWKLAGYGKWEQCQLYVPNGMEKYMGSRIIGGVEYIVFMCLNDVYLAQPSKICALPDPGDPMLVLSNPQASCHA